MAHAESDTFLPAPTGDIRIDALIETGSWAPDFVGQPIVLTYSLYRDTDSLHGWNTETSGMVRSALDSWSAVANISFQYVEPSGADYRTSNAQMAITFAGVAPPIEGGIVVGLADFPDPDFTDNGFYFTSPYPEDAVFPGYNDDRSTYADPEGDVFLFEDAFTYSLGGVGAGSSTLATAIHEIGHAIGLKHPFDQGANTPPYLSDGENNGYNTVMSYNDPQTADHRDVVSYEKGSQATPMPYDILAIQLIYGANMTYHAGDDDYLFRDDGIVQTIWDAGGTDIIDATNMTSGIVLDLREGALNRHGASGLSATAIAYNVTIENAIGTAYADIIVGNAANNTIDGFVGVDTMVGGVGDDTYFVGVVGEIVSELAGEGIDTVYSKLSYDLANDTVNVENLVLNGAGQVGSGNADDNAITGGTGSNTLTGLGGADTLDGGGGIDTLIGGTGDDVYFVDSTKSILSENAGEGEDEVNSTVTWTLGAEFENLTLLGTGAANAIGNGFDNILTGNAGKNVMSGGLGLDTLSGNAGNDTLNGDDGDDTLAGGDGNDLLTGGVGDDDMAGGLGDDTYIVDSVQDQVSESVGEGFDIIKTSVDYSVALLQSAGIENIVLTGTSNISAQGNAQVNILTGNAGDNTLDGQGGTDTMNGGAGNDTYVIDNAGDIINDTGGIDTVMFDFNHTFQNYQRLQTGFENITLTGTGDINAIGNSAANVLTGNSGDNTLDGFTGADTMAGGLGNDTYVADALDTIAVDTGGSDTVAYNGSYDISGRADLDNVTLLGTGAFNATGNGGDNTLTGNSGVNTLNGGLGNDTYVIDTKDVIVDAGGTDAVRVSFTYTLVAGLENLELSGTSAINGTGNSGDNTVTGNSGDNTLAGGLGNDVLRGGLGNDTYIVNDATETVSENAGEGSDTVRATVSHTLAAEVENLTLLGTAAINATGNAGDNTLTGNSAANVLTGGLGNDTYVADALDTIAVDTGGSDTVAYNGSYDISGRADLDNITLLGTGAFNATGNGGNNTLTGNSGLNTLNGGLGNDTYVVDTKDIIVDAGGTDTVVAGFAYTLGASMENLLLTGTANLAGTGNAGANTLTGNTGNNTLNGQGGTDAYIGGLGNDTYIVDNGAETVTELAGQGSDTVLASVSYALGAEIEALVLTGTGNINGTGNTLANTLSGNSGGNTLDGGAGADVLQGGTGDDTYIVDSAGDLVKETSGDDTVIASVTYMAAAGIENITLSGGANINAIGSSITNTLTGNTGDNTLDGGVGNDVMIGGLGDDTFVVDAAGDVVTELAAGGLDTVRASISYTLGVNLENLTLTGSALNGTGNGVGNTLTGNSGANTLDGQGGIDAYIGGAGNDVYIVDNSAETITELASQGNDTALAAADYVLGVNVENLVQTGTANIDGTGNALANILTGNSGDNTLDGGLGKDTMIGGLGDDTYFVDVSTDMISETAAQGTDTVFASASYTLAKEVEHLTLTGTAVSGTGNALDNVITGTGGDNTLSGSAGDDTLIGGGGNDRLLGGLDNDILSGGAGADTLTGDKGSDTFLFTQPPAPGEIDTITDFSNIPGGDVLDLADILTGYTGIVTDYVEITQVGNNTIISVDANGLTGGSSFVQVATLSGVNLGTDEAALVVSGHLLVT